MDEDEVSANPFDEEETDTPISFDKEADEDTDEEGLGELPSIVQRRGGGKNKVWTAQIMTVVILTMVTMIILAMVTMIFFKCFIQFPSPLTLKGVAIQFHIGFI